MSTLLKAILIVLAIGVVGVTAYYLWIGFEIARRF